MSLIIFYAMKSIFFLTFAKNPEDTFDSMDLSLMKDGAFNFLFGFWGC
jgi:hypothetical protein